MINRSFIEPDPQSIRVSSTISDLNRACDDEASIRVAGSEVIVHDADYINVLAPAVVRLVDTDVRVDNPDHNDGYGSAEQGWSIAEPSSDELRPSLLSDRLAIFSNLLV